MVHAALSTALTQVGLLLTAYEKHRCVSNTVLQNICKTVNLVYIVTVFVIIVGFFFNFMWVLM